MSKMHIRRLIFEYDRFLEACRGIIRISLKAGFLRISIMLRAHPNVVSGTFLLPTVLALAILASSNLSVRAEQDSLVIPGVSPSEVARQIATANRRAPRPGAYGGGFIDYLITGYSGSGARYNEPGRASGPIVYGALPAPAVAPTHLASLNLAPPVEAEAREVADPQFHRQDVAYDGRERPGTIIIDTPNKFLFLIEPNGRALRYGIGVGRPGFEWSGVKTISRKAEWPGWTPPPEMMLRRPDLPNHMDGGPDNPLGARALYLGSSMYRIHGTNEPQTIGTNVSSGCIRMMNQDVIDLYNRVPVGTKVIVI
jgi:lipoprotein-anchoring transpeptidase ErfK/SrfK